MNYHRNCSESGMFVFNSIPSFMELWRNYIYSFMQRLNNSDNTIVAATVSSCRLSSAMWRRWESVVYTKTSCLQSFFIMLVFICYFHCSCDRHLGLYYVSVFDQCLYHKCIVF